MKEQGSLQNQHIIIVPRASKITTYNETLTENNHAYLLSMVYHDHLQLNLTCCDLLI